MRYGADLRKLGPIAIALACAGGSTLALAQTQTYYHVGVWDAFSGRNDKGGAVCGVGNTNPVDNRRVSIRFDIGGANTVFSVSKPDWSIPDNTRVTVVMQIGLNTPWTEPAAGHGHYIDWSIDGAAMQTFDQQFRSASSMTLTFPDGTEAPWTISLTGSSAISDAFGRCIRDLTRQVQALQPRGGGAPAPQGGVPGGTAPNATQPFNPTVGGPPADASNGAPAPGPQPYAAPSAGRAPGGTQPYRTQPR